MSKRISVLFLALSASAAAAQSVPLPARPAGPPSTDIWLAPLAQRAGRWSVGAPVNITKRPGYDNQPAFTPDGRAILFTSVRADSQADIYRYDMRAKTIARVTATPESEYSPTVYGDGTRFSAIRVEADSTQRLWSFRLDGSDPRLLLPALAPVGYHAWIDDSTLALFVLGRPNALVLASLGSPRADTVARDVGRSLLPLPRGGGFSFVQHGADSSWILTAVDVRRTMGGRQTMPLPLVRLAPGADYVAWLAPAVALSGVDTKLLLWRATGAGAGRWTPVADLGRYGLRHITRVAVSADRKWVAIVAEPAR